MLAMIDLIEECKETGDKIIVFSQCKIPYLSDKGPVGVNSVPHIGTSNLDLIEIILFRHGIRHLRYDGGMDRVARESTLAIFKKTGGPKVILISTKCGVL